MFFLRDFVISALQFNGKVVPLQTLIEQILREWRLFFGHTAI